MKDPAQHYWSLRLAALKKRLEANNFKVYVAQDASAAGKLVLEEILPALKPKLISWGGSMTFVETGLYHALKERKGTEILDTYDQKISAKAMLERRRQGLLADVYFTGVNALTECGQLVNLDMYGNRVAALTFGPRHVVALAGRNKIVGDLDDALFRIKNYAAPTNTLRLDKKTPCVKTGFCEDCVSPDRICNTWTITEKSLPKGRIKVVLINQDIGL
ncbi:MAG: lactate utilization protein [Desulfobacterales bacterium]|nr:lactate utilization protein [Desulfobacterales bacterium]